MYEPRRIPWRIPQCTICYLCIHWAALVHAGGGTYPGAHPGTPRHDQVKAPAHTLAHTLEHNLLSMCTLSRPGASPGAHRIRTLSALVRPSTSPGTYPGADPGARLVIYADIGPTWYKPWRIPQFSLAETLVAYLAAELAARSLLRYRRCEADSGAYLLAHTPQKNRSFFHVAIYIHIDINI